MIALASLVSVITGVTLATVAQRFPAQAEAMETGAGALLIGGLALLGSGLPVV